MDMIPMIELVEGVIGIDMTQMVTMMTCMVITIPVATPEDTRDTETITMVLEEDTDTGWIVMDMDEMDADTMMICMIPQEDIRTNDHEATMAMDAMAMVVAV
jgi:hypothetical protein